MRGRNDNETGRIVIGICDKNDNENVMDLAYQVE